MKWHASKVVVPDPDSVAWDPVTFETPQKPQDVNFTGPAFCGPTSMPAMNCPLENETPACCCTQSTFTAVGPMSDPHCVSTGLPGPSANCVRWNPTLYEMQKQSRIYSQSVRARTKAVPCSFV